MSARRQANLVFRILGTTTFILALGVSALSTSRSTRLSNANRGVAQALDFQVTPSAHRGYCGLSPEDSACPFSDRNTLIRSTDRPIASELESRIRIIAGLRSAPRSTISTQDVARRGLRMVLKRAENLRNYWNLFSAPPVNGEFDPQLFSPQVQQMPELSQEAVRGATLQVLSSVLSETVRMADAAIRQTNDPSQLLNAASLWWAARFLQVQLACPDDQPPSDPLLRGWVDLQGGYQTCRRGYLEDALEGMRSTARGSRLALNTREWKVIWALGSRMERSQALLDLLERFDQVAGDPQAVSPSEVYFLAHQLMQVAYETRTRQVLTWNGFQPADPSDLDQLAREQRTLLRSFVRLMTQSRTLRQSAPTLYRSVRRAWNSVYDAVPQSDWTQAGLSALPREALAPHWERDCNDGVVAACTAWLIEHQAIPQMDSTSAQLVSRWESLVLGPNSREISFPRQTGMQEGIRLRSWLMLLETYRTQREAGLRSARTRTAWQSLHRRLQGRLFAAFERIAAQVPTRSSFLASCLNPSEWDRWTQGDSPILGPDLIEFLESSSHCETHRNWVFQVLSMRQMSRRGAETQAWQDNPVAVIARLGAWLKFFPLPHSAAFELNQRVHGYRRRLSNHLELNDRQEYSQVLMQQLSGEREYWRVSPYGQQSELVSLLRAVSYLSSTTRPSPEEESLLLNDPLF